MYLAAAHDPNDTRHATLRPPSHHDMHAQYVNPGALVPRTARILADRPRGSHRIPSSTPTEHLVHALRISYMQTHVITVPGSPAHPASGSRYTLYLVAARLCPGRSSEIQVGRCCTNTQTQHVLLLHSPREVPRTAASNYNPARCKVELTDRQSNKEQLSKPHLTTYIHSCVTQNDQDNSYCTKRTLQQ